MMNGLNRRDMLQTLGASLLLTSFSRIAGAIDNREEAQSVGAWYGELADNARLLRDKKITGLQWQEAMDKIYGDAPLQSLLASLKFDDLSAHIKDLIPADRPEFFHRLEIPGGPDQDNIDNREPPRVLLTKIAYVRKGKAVPPHGHSNMVSAFMCLSGEFEVRMYDKLEDNEENMLIRQTQHSKAAGPGTWSSISDYRDNVHWLTARSEECFLFTAKLINIEPDRELNGRINLDLRRPEVIGGNTYLAPKITGAEAAEIY